MILSALELGLSFLLLVAVVKAVKLRSFAEALGPEIELALEDYLVALPVAALVILPLPLRVAFGTLMTVGVTLLAVDALLFRLFTIELGTGGLGTIVWSALFREVAELELARRFLRGNPAFAALPVFTALAVARTILEPPAHTGVSVLFTLGLFAVLTTTSLARTRSVPALLAAATLTSGAIAFATPAPETLGAACVGVLAATLIRRDPTFLRRPSYLRHALGGGRLPDARGFVPRPEHHPLVEARPHVPRRTDHFGRLRKPNVILVTLESVGRGHLEPPFAPRTPFLDAFARASVRSKSHLCVSPNTNNAHLAIYGSHYAETYGPIRALLGAGYRGIYLTAADVGDYGLRQILARAGFDAVIDRSSFTPDRRDGGRISDWVLPTQGVARLREHATPGQPFFLHVHTTNTHVPYRVVDRACFERRSGDLGRFLDGIEEADAILAELFASLEAAGLLDDALVILSADHGQAFGELGYLSHASAVIAPEIEVPFFLRHPALGAGEVARSSHLDVLPTILDLLGVESTEPGWGDSIFAKERDPNVLVWAGHPTRGRSSNFGLVTADRKYMVDLVLSRCYEVTWQDTPVRDLGGEEKVYWTLLLHRILTERGLT